MAILIMSALALFMFTRVVSATVTMGLTAVETPANAPYASTSGNTITHSGLNVSKTRGATSTPVIDAIMQGSIVLTAGVATIDLTAGPGLSGATATSLNGKKNLTMLVKAKAANANPITIKFGAANPYTGFGAAFSVTLDPGLAVEIEGNATAVSATVKNLDVVGTAAQGLDIEIIAGP